MGKSDLQLGMQEVDRVEFPPSGRVEYTRGGAQRGH